MMLRLFATMMALAWLNLGQAQFQSAENTEFVLQQNEVVHLMEKVIQTSAAVEVAKADIVRAEATANLLRAGPYEFEASISAGKREITDPLLGDEQYSEWAGGLSRTIRLPGKRGTDQRLAEIEVELAQAAYEKSLYDERLAFIQRWSNWSSAYRLAEITSTQAREMATLAELEQKAVDQGSGRQVNADQLKAESELAALQAAQDELVLMSTQIELEAYYPNLILPSPNADFGSVVATIEHLLMSDIGKLPEQLLAEVSSEKAQLVAQRARQDRLPDPTLGLAITDEFGGQESSISFQISVPIGGSSRRASFEQAEAQLNMSELELAAANRTVLHRISLIEQVAQISLKGITDALETSNVSKRALAQFQQGYEIGALTLSEMITARRSHYLVERALIEQQGKNEQALLNYLALSFSQVDASYF